MTGQGMPIATRDRGLIADMLVGGYGVEDISVTLLIPADEVRRAVTKWRKNGTLRMIFGHSSDPRREFRFRAAMHVMTGKVTV